MSFVFWDTETTGIDTKFDQILQFAAIRTDDELNELERFEVRCRLDRHVVPSPMALQVTGQTIADITDANRASHYEMMGLVRAKLEEWTPATFVGWNTIGFDEPLLQQAFFKSLHPPYLTVMNGNERSDAMKLAQCLELFQPEVLTIPTGDNGKPSYKLDRLAPANGFPHLNAHDALADVEATIYICRLIKEASPHTWQLLCHCGSKHRVITDLQQNPVCLYRDSFFGRAFETAVTRFATSETGAELCFDLRVDPASFAHLDDNDLRRAVGRSPKPVRQIRPNKSPLIMPLAEDSDFGEIAYETLRERAAYLHENEALVARLVDVTTPDPFPPGVEVEERIFDGFPEPADQALMNEFHVSDWPRRVQIANEFADDRYRIIAGRIVLTHADELLEPTVRANYLLAEAARVTGHGVEGPAWVTLEQAQTECVDMLAQCEPEQSAMLHDFREYIVARIAEANDLLAATTN